MVLGDGKVLEFGSPQELLSANQSHFGSKVESTGQQMSKSLRMRVLSGLTKRESSRSCAIAFTELRHKRTTAMVQTMSPALLRTNHVSPADAAAGAVLHHKTPLPQQLASFQSQIQSLQHALEQSRVKAIELYRQHETSTTQSRACGLSKHMRFVRVSRLPK